MSKVQFELFRMRVFELIEKADRGDWKSAVYDYTMIASIIVSLLPLTIKSELAVFHITDRNCSRYFHCRLPAALAHCRLQVQKGGHPFFFAVSIFIHGSH